MSDRERRGRVDSGLAADLQAGSPHHKALPNGRQAGSLHHNPGIKSGEVDALLPTVYEELHGLAEAVLQHNRIVDSARTTSLIQDAYLRLADRGVQFRTRSHFLCVAARAMRHVLIDRARRVGAAKRGGGQKPVSLDESITPAIDGTRLYALDEALSRLATFDERKSQIVELRFFGGLSIEETAEAIGMSPATVKREWALARAWLYREIGDTGTKLPAESSASREPQQGDFAR